MTSSFNNSFFVLLSNFFFALSQKFFLKSNDLNLDLNLDLLLHIFDDISYIQNTGKAKGHK